MVAVFGLPEPEAMLRTSRKDRRRWIAPKRKVNE